MRLPKPFGFHFCLDEQKACPAKYGALFWGQAWHIKNQGRFWAFVEDTGKPGTRSSCYVPVAIYIIRKVLCFVQFCGVVLVARLRGECQAIPQTDQPGFRLPG